MKINLSIICAALVILFAATTNARGVDIAGLSDDGLTDAERHEIYGGLPAGDGGRAIQDMVIIDTTRPNCFFGLYRASQMTAPGWDLYERAFDWCNGNAPHATTMVWLATYNGTLDPKYSSEKDGIAIHDYLTTTMGIPAANIHVAHQSSIETASFAGYDIVLYVNTFARDATNVMNQNVPFLTTCAGETDEMGIGTGAGTMHTSRDYGCIINNSHAITSTYALGRFTLAAGMWMDATEAAGNGRVLITAEILPLNVDRRELSAAAGGIANFYLHAPSYPGRQYLLVAGVSGSSPGTLLPGGQVTIPVNKDWFTTFVLTHLSLPHFGRFAGMLSYSGDATARLNTYGSIGPAFAGKTLVFAYATMTPWDYASNAETIDVLP